MSFLTRGFSTIKSRLYFDDKYIAYIKKISLQSQSTSVLGHSFRQVSVTRQCLFRAIRHQQRMFVWRMTIYKELYRRIDCCKIADDQGHKRTLRSRAFIYLPILFNYLYNLYSTLEIKWLLYFRKCLNRILSHIWG